MARPHHAETRFSLSDLKAEMRRLEDPERARVSLRFFKTGKGEYGEGDRFLGLSVPQQRALAKTYQGLSLSEVKTLLQSPWHEHRLTALLILVRQYLKAEDPKAKAGKTPNPLRASLHQAYLDAVAADHVNNWDLVDSSAETLVGAHLFVANPAGTGSFAPAGRRLLLRMAASSHLWTRRVAMIATFHAIKRGAGHEAIAVAEALIDDPHDLMHKAVGWMLREVGKRDKAGKTLLRDFLDTHAATMPRTALRYALEKFETREKAKYMGLQKKRLKPVAFPA
jgi:3-methyladenine DNA glycosylase AlkD